MLGRGPNTFEVCPSERMAVDFFVMQDVLYGKGCHLMSVTPHVNDPYLFLTFDRLATIHDEKRCACQRLGS